LIASGCATGLTGDAASVSGTKARLSGNVASNVGGPVEYWFQYGPTTAHGSESTHQTASSTQANQPQPVVADIAGLARSSTYHFRLCAQDSQQQGGPGCGEDRTFTTTNLACGDVITNDFALSGTTTCESEEVGLVIGADGVDVNLNGHGLNGPTGPVSDETTGVGVDNGAGHDDVTIRNGSVLRWGNAVRLTGASFNLIRNVDLRQGASPRTGVRIDGGESNTIRSAQITGFSGLSVSGSEALVVADSSGYGWRVSGVGARLVRNDIGAVGPFTPCLVLSGNRNRVADNSLGGCAGGGIFLESGGENELVGNELEGGLLTGLPGDFDGVRVQPFTGGTLLQGNYAHGFHDDGIDVRAAATRLVGNRADSNGDFGIDAVAGVTDGGGNTASGNGGAAQCRNVVCAPSP
jgi:parallel beta-helix repeat protein